MNGHQIKLASAQDIAAARLDRNAVTHPKVTRGWQMGLAMVESALKDQSKPFAQEILASAAKLSDNRASH